MNELQKTEGTGEVMGIDMVTPYVKAKEMLGKTPKTAYINSITGANKYPSPQEFIDEIVELNSQNIISRSNAPSIISKYYFKFIAYDRLINNMEEMMNDKDINHDTNDAFDNLDSTQNYFNELNSPSNSRWNWKAN